MLSGQLPVEGKETGQHGGGGRREAADPSAMGQEFEGTAVHAKADNLFLPHCVHLAAILYKCRYVALPKGNGMPEKGGNSPEK